MNFERINCTREGELKEKDREQLSSLLGSNSLEPLARWWLNLQPTKSKAFTVYASNESSDTTGVTIALEEEDASQKKDFATIEFSREQIEINYPGAKKYAETLRQFSFPKNPFEVTIEEKRRDEVAEKLVENRLEELSVVFDEHLCCELGSFSNLIDFGLSHALTDAGAFDISPISNELYEDLELELREGDKQIFSFSSWFADLKETQSRNYTAYAVC